MKKLMNLSLRMIAVLSAAALVGCAFGNSTDEQTKQELEDREKLLVNYSRVVGNYSGTIYTNGKTIPLEVSVSTVDEENGKNSKGETKFIPVLKLRYRQMDTVRPDIIMNARYISENGSLSAAEGTDPTAGSTSTTIRGAVSGEMFTGSIYKSTGKLGDFDLTRISITPSSPLENPEVDYQNRLRALYNSITGKYDGTLTSTISGKSTTIRVVISSYDEYQNGRTYAVLRATLVNPETNVILAPPMTGSYQLETTPAILLIGSGNWSAAGTLENNVYRAKVTSSTGADSELVVERK